MTRFLRLDDCPRENLGIGLAMLGVGFGPIHFITTKMVVELSSGEPDGEYLDRLFDRVMKWRLLQTVFMLATILTMVGLHGPF